MRLGVLALVLTALTPTIAFGADLPLQDGDYTEGPCIGGSSDVLQSFDVQTGTAGRDRGHRYLYPIAEDQDGSCTTGKIDVKGGIYSGAAKCVSDAGLPIGTYRFSIQVLNSREFMSKGKKYTWCAAHR